MALFYGLKYTKSIQEILDTTPGQFACKLAELSVPALSASLEKAAHPARGFWQKSGHTPRQMAIVAVGLGIERYGAAGGIGGAISVALRGALKESVSQYGNVDFVAEILAWCDQKAETRAE